MSDRIFEVNQEGEKITVTFRSPSSGALAEAGDHARNASKEMLLSFRSLLDGCISMLEDEDDKKPRQKGSIKVE